MAREGLRVLVVSKKSLTEEQYQDFEVRVLGGPTWAAHRSQWGPYVKHSLGFSSPAASVCCLFGLEG
jgi:hypothetical protein